jgi:hypothetical protein
LISSTAVETRSTDSPSSSVSETLSSSSNEPSAFLSFETSSAFLSTFSIGFPAFIGVFASASSVFFTVLPTFIFVSLLIGAAAFGGSEGLTGFAVDEPVVTLDGAGVREAS